MPRLIHIPINFSNYIPALLKEFPLYQGNKERIKSVPVQTEYLLFFLSLIFTKQKHLHGDDRNVEVPMNSKTIRKYERNANRFLCWLCDRKIIECSSYQPLIYSRRYKFGEDYEFEPYYLKNRRLIEKIDAAEKEREDEIKNDPLRKAQYKALRGVEILPEADEWVKGQGFNSSKTNAILENLKLAREKDIKDGYFMVRGFKSGRIYTPHAHLKREIREKYCRIDGEEPAELDLRCSQWQILYMLIKDHQFTCRDPYGNMKADLRLELTRFASHFQDGNPDLYFHFSQEYGISREQMKKKMLSWLFSSKWEMSKYPDHRNFSESFKKHFPMILDVIMFYKDQKGSLASRLQQVESKVILESIVPKLFKEKFSFFTVHDSVILPKSKYVHVKENIWIPTLKELGFPQFFNNYITTLDELISSLKETELIIMSSHVC